METTTIIEFKILLVESFYILLKATQEIPIAPSSNQTSERRGERAADKYGKRDTGLVWVTKLFPSFPQLMHYKPYATKKSSAQKSNSEFMMQAWANS